MLDISFVTTWTNVSSLGSDLPISLFVGNIPYLTWKSMQRSQTTLDATIQAIEQLLDVKGILVDFSIIKNIEEMRKKNIEQDQFGQIFYVDYMNKLLESLRNSIEHDAKFRQELVNRFVTKKIIFRPSDTLEQNANYFHSHITEPGELLIEYFNLPDNLDSLGKDFSKLVQCNIKFFANNDSIRVAVKEWCENKEVAIGRYGEINGWDTSNVTDMSGLFKFQKEFNDDISQWNVSSVNDMSEMFYEANAFNRPLNSWDVSNVSNMEGMFAKATVFNQWLNDWNISKVQDMSSMFLYASHFNQPLNQWNVGSVNTMRNLFLNAVKFNQPLNDWDVSNVTDMSCMFSCYGMTFNQGLECWNTSNVLTMDCMFGNNICFNQPLNEWNVSNVVTMESMFAGATSFNQPLDKWNICEVNNMSTMFKNATSFNQSLDTWKPINLRKASSVFDGALNFHHSIWSDSLSDMAL